MLVVSSKNYARTFPINVTRGDGEIYILKLHDVQRCRFLGLFAVNVECSG